MNEKEILEGNKLIAAFMGAKLKHYNISNAPYYQMPDRQQWMPERLVYHTSWDWLMPVWVKIKFIGADMGRVFEPFWQKFHVGIDTGINVSFDAVVQFIQFYNQQN